MTNKQGTKNNALAKQSLEYAKPSKPSIRQNKTAPPPPIIIPI